MCEDKDRAKEYLKREVEATGKYLQELRFLRIDIHLLFEYKGDDPPQNYKRLFESLDRAVLNLKRVYQEQKAALKNRK